MRIDMHLWDFCNRVSLPELLGKPCIGGYVGRFQDERTHTLVLVFPGEGGRLSILPFFHDALGEHGLSTIADTYKVLAVVHDRWNQCMLQAQLRAYGIPCIGASAGFQTMTPAAHVLHTQLNMRLLRHDGNALLRAQVERCVFDVDVVGNMKPSRRGTEIAASIDGIVAMLFALTQFTADGALQDEYLPRPLDASVA